MPQWRRHGCHFQCATAPGLWCKGYGLQSSRVLLSNHRLCECNPPPKDCAPQHYEVSLPSPAAATCKDVCQSFLPLANYPVNVCCPNIPSLVMVSYPILLGLDLSTLWHLLWLNLRLRQWTWPKLYRWEVEEPVFLLTPKPILCLLQTKGWRNATGKIV